MNSSLKAENTNKWIDNETQSLLSLMCQRHLNFTFICFPSNYVWLFLCSCLRNSVLQLRLIKCTTFIEFVPKEINKPVCGQSTEKGESKYLGIIDLLIIKQSLILICCVLM